MWKRPSWSTKSINCPLSISAVKAFAWVIAKKIDHQNMFNSDTDPGDKWFRNFKKRENLTNRKPNNVDWGRPRKVITTVFKQHFDLLEKAVDRLTADKLNLNKPSSIFNCNMSMIATDRRTGKVVIATKKKQAYAETKGIRDHITAYACVHLQVAQFCDFILFCNRSWDGPDDALYPISPNGYMDSELFYCFLDKLLQKT